MKLNLGCGEMRLPGYVGVDCYQGPAVDVVCDLTRHPWPFESDSADAAVTWHFLEHLPGPELDLAMREIFRILRGGGTLYVKVPFKEKGPFNPYHYHVFDRSTFNAWIDPRDTRGGRPVGPQGLPGNPRFRRAAQDVVYVGGFPAWHIQRYLPWTEGVLFHRDERGTWSHIPSFKDWAPRELREWLVKP